MWHICRFLSSFLIVWACLLKTWNFFEIALSIFILLVRKKNKGQLLHFKEIIVIFLTLKELLANTYSVFWDGSGKDVRINYYKQPYFIPERHQ